MKITAQEEYGLRCMLLLAKSGANNSLTIPEIAGAEGLSISYIAKLLMILKQAGLIKAARGRNGGYMLADPPDIISLETIFKALGDPLYSSRHCSRHKGELKKCVHTDDCQVRGMWKSFSHFISSILQSLTLADLQSGKYESIAGSISRVYENIAASRGMASISK
jgi:Rrf2 family protein